MPGSSPLDYCGLSSAYLWSDKCRADGILSNSVAIHTAALPSITKSILLIQSIRVGWCVVVLVLESVRERYLFYSNRYEEPYRAHGPITLQGETVLWDGK